MKKLVLSAACALCAASVFAGGIENKTNMSTGYLRNPSRNSESKRPEAAFYNIAGTAFMEDGLYFEVGNQFIIKEYKNEIDDASVALNGKSYNDETTVLLYPDADIVYKHGNWAAFANFGIYAGGGKLDYSEGTSITALAFGSLAAQYAQDAAAAGVYQSLMNNHSLKVTSITYGGQIGGAYVFNDIVSVAAAFRLTYGTQELTLKLPAVNSTVEYEASALGISGVFGVHTRPLENLDVSGQFAWRSKMNYEIDSLKGGDYAASFDLTKDSEFRTDLSPVLNIGVGYQVIEPLYVSASFNYYFNNLAKMNSALGESDYNNSFEIGCGADYDFNEKLTASFGLAYGKQGTTDEANNALNPVLDSFQLGAGVEFKPVEDFTLIGAVSWVKYFEDDYSVGGVNVKLTKPALYMFSVGGTYRLPL